MQNIKRIISAPVSSVKCCQPIVSHSEQYKIKSLKMTQEYLIVSKISKQLITELI